MLIGRFLREISPKRLNLLTHSAHFLWDIREAIEGIWYTAFKISYKFYFQKSKEQSFNNLPLLCYIFYHYMPYTNVCCFFTYCQTIFWRMDERTAFSLMNWNKILALPYLLFSPDSALDGVSLPFLLQDKVFSIHFNKCGLGVIWVSLYQVQEVGELYLL